MMRGGAVHPPEQSFMWPRYLAPDLVFNDAGVLCTPLARRDIPVPTPDYSTVTGRNTSHGILPPNRRPPLQIEPPSDTDISCVYTDVTRHVCWACLRISGSDLCPSARTGLMAMSTRSRPAMVAAVFIVDQSPCVLPTQVAEGRGHHVTVICVAFRVGALSW